MPVTLAQIADAAGVSPGTVSRVLAGRLRENRPAIAARAERVRRIAREMGYRTNHAARSVATGRFGQFAFVTCGELGFDWFAPSLLHGIHEAADAINCRLMLDEVPAAAFDDPESLPRLFREAAVDGLLVNLDAGVSRRPMAVIDAHPVPAVLLNRKRTTRAVFPDEHAGGRAAAARQLALGYKRPGFFMLADPSGGDHYSRRDRPAGWAERLAEAGVPADRRLLGVPGYRRSDGRAIEHAAAFLTDHPDVTSVVCYGALEASALLLAAAGLGRRVPEDLHVLTYNFKLYHAEYGVALDTLVVPFAEVGRRAVGLLNEIITGDADRQAAGVAVPYERLYRAAERDTVTPDE